jgi:arylsulfatase A-like enzyme
VCASDVASQPSEQKAKDQRPNILLILLDDAGYGDIEGFSEQERPTPHLKQLAEQGVRFERFYADSTCRPARVSLLTGQQASRVTMTPDFVGISPEVETLPEKLQQAGYTTYHIGKWHLGDTTMLAWPSAQGFDHWFGFLNQFVLRKGFSEEDNIHYRRPTYKNPWLQRDDGPPQQHNGHLEDLLTEEVIHTIEQLQHSEQPWFINYWTFAPHNPAVPASRYRVRYPEGTQGQYEALLDQLDSNLGQIFSMLEKTGQADNTLVLVMSDNGGTNELMKNNGPYEGIKGMYSEGGTRTPMVIRWPGHLSAGKIYTGISTLYDLMPTLLAAAGVESSESYDGINLLPLLEKDLPRPPQSLFWEIGTNFVYQYSVLSADGRWRLDSERLFDLKTDPFAREDVSGPQQEIYQGLKQQFLQWRRQVHHLSPEIKVHRDRQVYEVRGDSFRRSPGYGGFTFVTSIRPDKKQTPQGIIAEQKGMWSLRLDDARRLHLQMHDQQLVSDEIELGDCTPLVVSVYYSRSKLMPQHDSGVWFILAGDEEVLVEQRPSPSLFPENFLEPTWVGQDAEGKEVFSGFLETPQFYNDFYYLNDPWDVERSPHWLTEDLCGAVQD